MDLSSFIEQTIRATIDADGITFKGDVTKDRGLKIIADADFFGDDNVILSFKLQHFFEDDVGDGPNASILSSIQWTQREFGGLVLRSVTDLDTLNMLNVWRFGWLDNQSRKAGFDREGIAEWIRARLSEMALC